MQVRPVRTRIFTEGENLAAFIRSSIKKVPDGSVVVVTSKIVALAEKRTSVKKNEGTKEQLVKRESEVAIPTRHSWLTVTDGMMVTAAGIDESNGNGKYILLPRDSYRSAHALWKTLKAHYRVQHLGVVIVDSRTLPLRAGAVGVALGYAGISGIRDYRGTPDLFGRLYRYSRANVVDALAAAAVLVMGEGREQRPLAVVSGSDVRFVARVSKREVKIELQDDMYHPLYAWAKKHASHRR